MSKCHVYHPHFDRIVFTVAMEQAAFMVQRKQAEPLRRGTIRRGIRLTTTGVEHLCRTFVSVANSKPGREPTESQTRCASGGRSQQYLTRDHRGRVTGFKTIHAEDKPLFSSATLDCITEAD
jgi:hypothetical protein